MILMRESAFGGTCGYLDLALAWIIGNGVVAS